MSQGIVLYTTLGCHLCEQAEALVRQVMPMEWELVHVDVAEDDALLAAYGERIPVIAINGQELAWPFGLLELQAVIYAG